MSTKTALQLNAIVGLASTVAAGAMISLVLSRPESVAASLAQHDYGAIVTAVVTEVVGWLHAIVRFL